MFTLFVFCFYWAPSIPFLWARWFGCWTMFFVYIGLPVPRFSGPDCSAAHPALLKIVLHQISQRGGVQKSISRTDPTFQEYLKKISIIFFCSQQFSDFFLHFCNKSSLDKNISIWLLGQKSSLDKSLLGQLSLGQKSLGQLSPWTIAPWTIVAVPDPPPTKKMCWGNTWAQSFLC